MLKIINQLNESNSANYKLQVLKEHSSNELFQKLLKMTYCTVSYTYGISLKRVRDINEDEHKGQESLENALRTLETQFATRNWSGNLAHEMLEELLLSLSADDAEVLRRVIDRDLKINIGKTQINKVFKNLIVDLPYMRCGVYSDKTSKKISFPAILQEKADGMSIFTSIYDDKVICHTRSGEMFKLKSMQFLKDTLFLNNVIQGEFLIENLNDRAESNGLLNSLIKFRQNINNSINEDEATNIESKIIYQIWDLIPIEDYWFKNESNIRYLDRFKKLSYNFASLQNQPLY